MKTTCFIISILFLMSCGNAQYNGTYCVDVDYYNSNTGKQSSYRLTANTSNNKLLQLNFPSDGHVDSEDFGNVEFKGKRAIASVGNGVSYKVKILKSGNDCFNDVPKAKRCKGYTKSGGRCNNKTDNRSGFCPGIVHISVSMLNNNSNRVSFLSNLKQLTC